MNWTGWLQGGWQRLAEIAKTPLNTPRRLYLAGFTLAVLGGFQSGFTGAFWTMVGAGLGAICVGFLMEVWAKIKTLLTSSIARNVAVALGGAVITFPSYILAHHSVNRITGLAPDAFPFSIPLIAAVYWPLVLLIAVTVILGAYFLWQVLGFFVYGMQALLEMIMMPFLGTPLPTSKERELLHVSRMIAAITLISVFGSFSGLYDQSETWQQFRKELIVDVDYYPRSPCSNVTAQERVAFLKEDKISVATRKTGGWDFRLANCEAE